MEQLERFLLVSAIALFVYVFYKWLLKYFRSKEIQGSFPYVYPFTQPLIDSIELIFDLPAAANVNISIYTEAGDLETTFIDKGFESGNNEMSLPVRDLPRGVHELVIVFPNQTTRRVIELQ